MRKEQDNRHDLQRTAIKQVGFGQLYTFGLSALGIVCGTIIVGLGHAAGLAGLIPAIIALLQAIWQRHKQDKQEQQQLQPPSA